MPIGSAHYILTREPYMAKSLVEEMLTNPPSLEGAGLYVSSVFALRHADTPA